MSSLPSPATLGRTGLFYCGECFFVMTAEDSIHHKISTGHNSKRLYEKNWVDKNKRRG